MEDRYMLTKAEPNRLALITSLLECILAALIIINTKPAILSNAPNKCDNALLISS